jgi:tripeptide aminopeptidase
MAKCAATTPSRAATVIQAIRDTFESTAAAAGARAEVDLPRSYAGYELGETDQVVALARRAFAAVDGGVSPLLRSGGGSDANELNVRGITACVLGIGAEACHSVDEHISVAELELLTTWALEIVNQAAQPADHPAGRV